MLYIVCIYRKINLPVLHRSIVFHICFFPAEKYSTHRHQKPSSPAVFPSFFFFPLYSALTVGKSAFLFTDLSSGEPCPFPIFSLHLSYLLQSFYPTNHYQQNYKIVRANMDITYHLPPNDVLLYFLDCCAIF